MYLDGCGPRHELPVQVAQVGRADQKRNPNTVTQGWALQRFVSQNFCRHVKYFRVSPVDQSPRFGTDSGTSQFAPRPKDLKGEGEKNQFNGWPGGFTGQSMPTVEKSSVRGQVVPRMQLLAVDFS
eukprot:2899792-Rhodomonas_salina.1